MQLVAGDRLGQYEILGSLGAGGMGEVYRARDARLGRDVALKILPAELASNPEALRRFEQEARAASALNHPNIVTIYDIGTTGDLAWISMELVEGLDLRTAAVREPLSLKTALRIASKVADGLAAAHDRGIVHRDLKPENVMVTSEGFVKILDFGLAKQVRVLSPNDTTIPHTAPGTVFGTVGYMSPEQAMGHETDYRTDQFAFGVMLYEMLTRTRPFDRPTKPETLTAIIRDDPPPPSSLNEGVPFDLDRVVSRCLAKVPRERYASTRDLARDVREIRDIFTNESAKVRSGSQPPLPLPQRSMLIPLVAAFCVLALGLMGFMYWRKRPAQAAVPAGEIHSVVMMPFRDHSGSNEGRLLANGIGEMVAAHLAEVGDLQVSTTDREAEDVRVIRRRSGAQAVVRGGVQRSGDEIRVTWALVETASGRTLHSSAVTGSATRLFALEDAVASELTRALRGDHTPPVRSAATALDARAQRIFVEAFGIVRKSRDEKALDVAVASLESLMRDHRDSPAVNALLARALLNKAALSGRPALVEQATVYAHRAIALDPRDPEALVTLGSLQSASGKDADALRSFEKALALRPKFAEAIVGMADAYQQLGRGAEAERMYQKALDLRPDSAGAFMKYGAFCLARGRYEDAVARFAKAVELLPDSAHALVNLGSAYHALGRYDQALESYSRSIALQPTAAAFSNTGTIHFYAGRHAEACRAYERATELAPADFVMWANLADAYRWTPELRAKAPATYDRAIAVARDALRVNERDAFARGVVAVAHAKNGSPAEAGREMQAALAIDPTHPVVLYQAAVVALLEGRRDSALSWLERSIAAGYSAADVQADPEFAGLKGDPAFQSAVTARRTQSGGAS